jgi:hypothetical protein
VLCVYLGEAPAPSCPQSIPSHTVSFPFQEHGVHRIHHDALVSPLSPLGVGPMPAARPIGAVICPCVSVSHSQQHAAMLVAFHDKTFLPRRDTATPVGRPMLRDGSRTEERRTADTRRPAAACAASSTQCLSVGSIVFCMFLPAANIPSTSLSFQRNQSGPLPRRASVARHATPTPSPAMAMAHG